ncbi:MAG: acyltransferase family protein [Eubacterium sp.]
MLILLIIVLLIIFNNIKVAQGNKFFDDYLSVSQTKAINGLFTILIFFSHASQYVNFSGALDAPYMSFRKYMGQLVVVMFLFYSGFGIAESIKKKGVDYTKSIPFKRFFRVWYHFAIAVILFIIANIIRHRSFGIKENLLAFTGWTSIGNSNWYMLAVFALYIITFISFMIFKKRNYLAVILVFILTALFAVFERKMGVGEYYYNTIFCYPVGMAFSLIKPYLDKIVMKHDIIWAGGFAVLFAVYYYFSSNRTDSPVHHIIWAALASILMVMITMKVKIGNDILEWFGNHVFSIFILQRIPMILLFYYGFNDHKYSFLIVSFIATIVIALIFDEAMDKLDSLIYKRKAVKLPS